MGLRRNFCRASDQDNFKLAALHRTIRNADAILRAVIPGRAIRSRKARPDDANPESISPVFAFSTRTLTPGVWIPGPREYACPGMTNLQNRKARDVRGPSFSSANEIPGAGEGIRTLDPDLGKVVLYH
jgi:hypothetical protein